MSYSYEKEESQRYSILFFVFFLVLLPFFMCAVTSDHECTPACLCECLCWDGYTCASLSVGVRSQFGVLLLRCNSLCLEAGSLIILEFTKWAGLADSGLQRLTCLYLPVTGMTVWGRLPDFFFFLHVYWGLNTSLHAWKASTFLTSFPRENLWGSFYIVLKPITRRHGREEFTHV